METANNLINALTEYLVEQEERYQELSGRIGELEGGGEPIDPPVDPTQPTVTIVNRGNLNPGYRGHFEAIIEGVTDDEIEKVVFKVEEQENVEKNYPYESWPIIPQNDFEVSAKIYLSGGAASIVGSQNFQVSDTPGNGGGSSGATSDIAEFNTFVTESDGTYYTLNADNETAETKSESQVEALFNTTHSHMGKPDNRCAVEAVPGLTNRQGFSFIINSESGGFGDRFATHKTNGLNENDIDYYPQASELASYSELYFDSAAMPMRTHFKCSSFSSASPPGDGTNTTDGSVRTTDPGEAELVRWEFYDKHSQPLNDPENKGDVMKLYFNGTNTNWSQSDYDNLMDTSGYIIMGMATYCAHPMTYRWQNMIYPCKPDANGLPTTERLLIPTDTLIKSWVIWKSNTVVNGVGQYDGSAKWWLQIPGIHNGEPFQAAIVENFLWVTGQDLIIESGGVGAYFNNGDEPNQDNRFFVVKDEIYYKSYA